MTKILSFLFFVAGTYVISYSMITNIEIIPIIVGVGYLSMSWISFKIG